MYYSIDDLLNLHDSGIAVYSKGLIIHAYENRYNALKSRIIWGLCIYEDRYIAHLRIPSESAYCTNVFYDVVFELYPTRDVDNNSGTLKNYGMKLFTNAPSFTYTFTYAYNKYNLIIDWLKPKCIKQCLIQPAIVRNPNNIIGTDSKVWFAAYHFKMLGLYDKRRFTNTITTSKKHIEKIIYNQAQVIRARMIAENQAKLKEQHIKHQAAARTSRNERVAEKGIATLVDVYAKSQNMQVNGKAVSKRIAKAARGPKLARLARNARKVK